MQGPDSLCRVRFDPGRMSTYICYTFRARWLRWNTRNHLQTIISFMIRRCARLRIAEEMVRSSDAVKIQTPPTHTPRR